MEAVGSRVVHAAHRSDPLLPFLVLVYLLLGTVRVPGTVTAFVVLGVAVGALFVHIAVVIGFCRDAPMWASRG